MNRRHGARAETRATSRRLAHAVARGEGRATTMARELERLSRRHREARTRLQAPGSLVKPDRPAGR